MVLIAEDKIGNEIQYKQIIKDEKKIISETHIVYYATDVHRDGRIFYLLYDKNMNPNEEVFDYINDFLYLQSENSQSKALYALKFLYCFQDIIGKELYEFSASDIVALKSFLRGFNRKGNFLSYENLTSRSAETVNGYLSIYRGYLDFWENRMCIFRLE